MAITLAAEHDKDEALYQRIAANNLDLEKENLRIQRFNDDLVIAIATDQPLNGKVATTYRAYPVDSTGKIRKDIHLIAKIIYFTETEKENITQQKLKLNHIKTEAKNGNVLFSSTIGKIENGRIILMSEVPGISLLTLIEIDALAKLNAIQRIQLCINVLRVYAILHARGIFHRDVTAGNLLIHLKTLRGMPVDIDPSHQTQLTKAPEQETSAQFDLFSIALDIFIPILSGIRPSRDTEGNLLNFIAIENAIIENFGELADAVIELLAKLISANPAERGTLAEAQQALQALFDSEAFLYYIAPDILLHLLSGVYPQRDENGDVNDLTSTAIAKGICTKFVAQSAEIIGLLNKLVSDAPVDRGTVQDGQNAFKKLLHLIEEKQKDEILQSNAEYDEQLRILDTVLQDPQFKNRMSPEKNYTTYPHFHEVHRYPEPIEIPTPRLITAP